MEESVKERDEATGSHLWPNKFEEPEAPNTGSLFSAKSSILVQVGLHDCAVHKRNPSLVMGFKDGTMNPENDSSVVDLFC